MNNIMLNLPNEILNDIYKWLPTNPHAMIIKPHINNLKGKVRKWRGEVEHFTESFFSARHIAVYYHKCDLERLNGRIEKNSDHSFHKEFMKKDTISNKGYMWRKYNEYVTRENMEIDLERDKMEYVKNQMLLTSKTYNRTNRLWVQERGYGVEGDSDYESEGYSDYESESDDE